MHDIKYFFSIKIIRQFKERQKKIQKKQINKIITEKYYFSKYTRRGSCPGPIGSAPVYYAAISKERTLPNFIKI
jgi:hypothetical protein